MSRIQTVLGVDGCHAGWIVAADNNGTIELGLYPTFLDLVNSWKFASRILIDVPIGLPDRKKPSRECDTLARRCLAMRASSVFTPPCRDAASAASIEEARSKNLFKVQRSLSTQAWGICRKIAEVDRVLLSNRDAREIVYEVHPEVCFCALNGGKPMNHTKRSTAGKRERLELLLRWEPRAEKVAKSATDRYPRRDVQVDDVLDALVALITARAEEPCFRSLPDPPEVDERGLPMRIIYRARGDMVQSDRAVRP